jgi:pilus assembly protein CpaE
MSKGPPAAPQSGREPFIAFTTDDATFDIVLSVATQLGWRGDACKTGGVRAAVQALSVAASPSMMLVDLSESEDPLGGIEGLADVCEPGTVVLAVGRVNDVALYRELTARGIHDYLVKPLTHSLLQEAIERARATLSSPREKESDQETPRRSIGVVGTRGGVGATMVASSLAWLLGGEQKRSTALLDLDVHFGTGALVLDLEPGRGLADAIDDPNRIDGLFIERAMVRAGEKLSVMSAEAPLSADLMTDGSAFLRLTREFRQTYEATIIDLPRSTMLNFPQLLAELSTIVLVTELTLASARDAIRILSWLKNHAPDAHVIVLANKIQAAGGEIGQADLAAAIERPIDLQLPFDPKGAVQAAKLGQPFAQANRASKSVAALLHLARLVTDGAGLVDDAGVGRGRPASLLGRLDLKAFLPRKPASAAALTAPRAS